MLGELTCTRESSNDSKSVWTKIFGSVSYCLANDMCIQFLAVLSGLDYITVSYFFPI